MSVPAYSLCGHGDAVVFIHGWGVHSGVWAKQVDKFSDEFQVVTVDLPGHGLTPPLKKGPLTIATAVEDMVGLLNSLSLKDIHFVGWSLGAQIALLAAQRLTARRVRSITLVSGTPCFVAPGEDDTWAIPEAKAKWFRRSLENDYRANLEEFILGFFRSDIGSDSVATAEARSIFFDENFPPDETSAKELLDDFLAMDMRENLGGLDIPCLICHGEIDTIVPVEVSNMWKRLLPTSKIVIYKECGHTPFLTHAADFNESLKTFLVSSQV